MILSKEILPELHSSNVALPSLSHFDLPERVLQFGTGVLLRGLPDYFIDQANKQNKFNGRIVVVKSTSKGDLSSFHTQDNLYTICVRGIENGAVVEKNIISSAVSRVLDATTDWESVLAVGRSTDLKLIISNTTEVGLVLLEEQVMHRVPESYPGKLLAVLYERFNSLGNDAGKLVVIATELVPDNGKVLHSIVLELISVNSLDNKFIEWLKDHVYFCSSLVDRIIPGKPEQQLLEVIEEELGYKDDLLIMAEPYRLWAIEGNEEVEALIGLQGIDDGIVVQPDIEIFRELKVRLLNGTHTLASGIAFLAGIETVSDAMADASLRKYINEVMHNEIIPSIPYHVEDGEAAQFAKAVVDRFSNTFIKHLWSNITFQYTTKLKIRIVPLIIQHYKFSDQVPERIAFGFAAYLHYISAKEVNGVNYEITDDKLTYINSIEKENFVYSVLSDESLWDGNLTDFNGFEVAVDRYFNYITNNGVIAGLALLK
jgi:tagaturonate reductase